MRIVRFRRTAEEAVEFGCLEGGRVFSLVGDPLGNPTVGEPVGVPESVVLLAPCQPTKIVAVAINFAGIEGFSPTMSEPMVFIKPASSVANPGAPVINPFPALPWWGEAELGVVIRKRVRNIREAQAHEFVLGFTIGNDATVENVEHRDHHLARSKCPDSFCPIGPLIDTEFDARDCVIEALQNGEVIRRGRSSQQFWQWPRIVAWLSTWMTLEPWDVVLTGNAPDTVGMRFISHGDVYTARVDGLGELTNPFFNQST